MKRVFSESSWDETETHYKFITKRVRRKEKYASENPQNEPGAFVKLRAPNNMEEPHIEIEQKPNKLKKKRKVKKSQRTRDATNQSVTEENTNSDVASCSNIVSKSQFSDKLRESLKGSRFRFLNEQLYTTDGNNALEIFRSDTEAFKAYHEGYRKQVEQWPQNPLDRIIKSIRKLPKHLIIADFGCGEARLAQSVQHKVFSIDLVSANELVIACDMAKTPLEAESINVAVYCLSLMGTNLKDFLLEANRVLKIGGTIKIAEISSRFDNVNDFIIKVTKCGFELLNKDLTTKFFYYFEFKKVKNLLKEDQTIRQFSLKPCLYKKR